MARRRGRRPSRWSRRNATTRAARRGDIDFGPPALLLRKMMLAGHRDAELSPSGILWGRQLIDQQQAEKLGEISEMLRRVARAMGRGIAVDALWKSIAMGGIVPTRMLDHLVGDKGARIALEKLVRNLNGSRSLVIELASEGGFPPIVWRAVTRSLTPGDLVALEELRQGLDSLAR